MNCKNCNNLLADNVKFCGKCGTSVSNEKTIEKKTPLTTSQIVKKVFQIIAVILFVLSLGTISSSSNHSMDGWFGTIYDIFNITALITVVALITNSWQNRKKGKNKKWFGWRWIAFLIILSLIGLGTAIFSQALIVAREKAMQNPDLKAEYIKNVVEAAKAQMSFPKQIDESTMMTGISAGENSVRYSYLLSGLDTSNLSKESFKDSLRPSICQSESTKNLFDKGIDLEFSYFVKESRQGYLVRFTPSDCL